MGHRSQPAGQLPRQPLLIRWQRSKSRLLAEQVFPKVGEQGAYAACGADGNMSACPYTDRLKARLTELRQTLLRAQNLSTTREITAEMMSPVVGIAHVTLSRVGRDSIFGSCSVTSGSW